ncbi:MAG: phosphotransferase [Caldilineaceae bacterium]
MQYLDRTMLTGLTQAATDIPNFQLDKWQTTTLSVQGQRTVFRFAGVGQDGSTPRPWSLILKEIKAPERADAIDHQVDCAFYWPRESLLYAAGIPQSLPHRVHHKGLRAPRCFGVMEPTPDLRWIWLEDLRDRYAGQWPLQQYALAGYQLGLFNGSYLVDNPLPTAPWLTDNGLRSESANKVADLARLRNPAIWAHPLLRHAYPTPILADLEQLAADRERFLAGAATFPRTFCHLDAHAGNMAAVEEANGSAETVLFDWALAGYGFRRDQSPDLGRAARFQGRCRGGRAAGGAGL